MDNIKQILNNATAKLRQSDSPTPALDAEVLLSFALNKPREYLFSYPEKKLTAGQSAKFKKMIARRLKGEPVAYIRGFKEFYGLKFIVNKNVLIPRPETELLIEEVIRVLQATSYQPACRQAGLQAIADIGTGSGAIVVTLSKLFPRAKIYATDISAKALLVAKKNAQRHGVIVKFLRGDLLLPLKQNKIDVITANLPYLKSDYREKLPKRLISSLKYEPTIALKAGKDGLDLYRRLFGQISQAPNKPKYIFCEIGDGQAKLAKKIAAKSFPQASVEIKKDLSGLKRLLIIKLF